MCRTYLTTLALRLFVVLAAFPTGPSLQAQPLSGSPPNIVWIFCDDLAVQAVGAYPSRFASMNLTPNMDRLAREGMVFDRAYVANSICAPSRATLLTGKHSHLNGKLTNSDPFDHGQPQFQKVLQQRGYTTALLGKLHIDGNPQGFDHWQVLPGQGKYESPEFLTPQGLVTYPGHETDVITDLSLEWITAGRDKAKPFMAMVHFKAPHRNWIPAGRFREKFKNVLFPEPDSLSSQNRGNGHAAQNHRMSILADMTLEKDLKVGLWEERTADFEARTPEGDDLLRWKYQGYMRDYFACVAGVDENIGRILEALEKQGLAENTVVMLSSDQGFWLGERGWFDKRFMYEESYRTPLVVRWPGVVKPASRNGDLVQNIDFAPTFLDMAEAPMPDGMQGRSLLPLLKGQTTGDWRSALYYHFYDYPGTHDVRRHEGVSTKTQKLIRFYGPDVPNGEEWEFYDLTTDPSETRNEFANPSHAKAVAGLKAELTRLRKLYNAP